MHDNVSGRVFHQYMLSEEFPVTWELKQECVLAIVSGCNSSQTSATYIRTLICCLKCYRMSFKKRNPTVGEKIYYGLPLLWTYSKPQENRVPYVDSLKYNLTISWYYYFWYTGRTSRAFSISSIKTEHGIFGRLIKRVFNNKDLNLTAKIRVYNDVVISTYYYETWTLYQCDIKKLELFHLQMFYSNSNIKSEYHMTNTKLLERDNSQSIRIV